MFALLSGIKDGGNTLRKWAFEEWKAVETNLHLNLSWCKTFFLFALLLERFVFPPLPCIYCLIPVFIYSLSIAVFKFCAPKMIQLNNKLNTLRESVSRVILPQMPIIIIIMIMIIVIMWWFKASSGPRHNNNSLLKKMALAPVGVWALVLSQCLYPNASHKYKRDLHILYTTIRNKHVSILMQFLQHT